MKLHHFLANAKLLHGKLGITPLLYGSLGLEYLTGQALASDDIDILVPERFLNGQWSEFKKMLERHGYVLTDEREHTFEKEGIRFSYAEIEDLVPFANVDPAEIPVREEQGCPFMLLSLRQYLQAYRASSRDGYRVNVRGKKDAEKLDTSEMDLEEAVAAMKAIIERKLGK